MSDQLCAIHLQQGKIVGMLRNANIHDKSMTEFKLISGDTSNICDSLKKVSLVMSECIETTTREKIVTAMKSYRVESRIISHYEKAHSNLVKIKAKTNGKLESFNDRNGLKVVDIALTLKSTVMELVGQKKKLQEEMDIINEFQDLLQQIKEQLDEIEKWLDRQEEELSNVYNSNY